MFRKFYFFDRTSTTAANKWNIILDIDQSGSMGESVIYSSIISCILASMNSVKTRVVAFDMNVVDLTEKCEDPVDLLFGFQLGGGTDINRYRKSLQNSVFPYFRSGRGRKPGRTAQETGGNETIGSNCDCAACTCGWWKTLL